MSLPEPPSNFRYQESDQTLHWDGVDGALEYDIQYQPDDGVSAWETAYNGGNDTYCSFAKPSGRYKAKGKSRKQGGWGDYGLEEIIEIP